MEKIAWTPESAVEGLGAVMIDPSRPLTRARYLLALSERLDRLTEQEPPQRAMELLRATAAQEGISLPQSLPAATEAFVEGSDVLRARSGANGSGFPVPKAKLTPSSRAARAIRMDSLEDFLSRVHPAEEA